MPSLRDWGIGAFLTRHSRAGLPHAAADGLPFRHASDLVLFALILRVWGCRLFHFRILVGFGPQLTEPCDSGAGLGSIT